MRLEFNARNPDRVHFVLFGTRTPPKGFDRAGNNIVTPSLDAALPFFEYACPYTKRVIRHALKQRQKAIEASRSAEAGEAIPAPDGCTYLPFQQAGIRYALARRGTIIGDPPGAGKSIQALGVINASPDIRRVLLICPATLRMNWERETQKWLCRHMRIWIAGRDGVIPLAEQPIDDLFVIVNFERIRDDPRTPIDHMPTSALDTLLSISWDLLVVDEAHRSKNPQSCQGFNVLKCLAPQAKKVLFLTGTPFDKPHQVKHLAETLVPGLEINDTSSPAEVQEILRATCLVRRRKEDVLPQLPPKRHQTIWLDPAGRLGPATLTAPCGHFAERHRLALAKTPFIVEHLQRCLENGIEKLVCFVHHRDVLHSLADHFPDALVLSGQTPTSERQSIIDSFQNERKYRLFLGSLHAAGVGITLTAASHVVLGEIDWTDEVVSQVENRVHRIGQKNPVLIQHLVFAYSLDARMLEVVLAKRQVAYRTLDQSPDARPCTYPKPPNPYPATTPADQGIARLSVELLLDSPHVYPHDRSVVAALVRSFHLTDGQTWLARSLACHYRQLLPECILRHLTLVE